ncbi:hypothetical protein ACMD2_25129, partial [Ananas comosus]
LRLGNRKIEKAMEKAGRAQSVKVLKKGKKKQAKDELDRLKQAEKKKRQKKEEQQRLDEEGAAIAEAVALQVLIEEDANEPCRHLMLKDYRKFDPCSYSSSISPSVASQKSFSTYPFGGLGWEANAYSSGGNWTDWGAGQSFPSLGFHRDNISAPYFEETGQQTEISPGFIAAQAVSSLQIGDDSSEGRFALEVLPEKSLGTAYGVIDNDLAYYVRSNLKPRRRAILAYY